MQSSPSWEMRYNTGNFVIDHQNRHLFQLIDDLENVGMQTDLNPNLIDIIYDEMSEYTNYNFKTEEDIMKQINYSELEEHKKIHADFYCQLNLHKAKNKEGLVYIDKCFCDSLKSWLIRHISNEDKKIISELLGGHGVV